MSLNKIFQKSLLGQLNKVISVRANHSIHPQVQKPAPDFKGTAVVDKKFKNI